MNTMNSKISKMSDEILSLALYQVRIWRETDFIDYIRLFENKLTQFEEINLMGHFDNAFASMVEELLQKYPNCRLKVISHGGLNKNNLRGLKKIEESGGVVRVNPDTHARMFLGINPVYGVSELIIGSFDYNRDSTSRYKVNMGVYTKNPDLINQANKQFRYIWMKSQTLEEYKAV